MRNTGYFHRMNTLLFSRGIDIYSMKGMNKGIRLDIVCTPLATEVVSFDIRSKIRYGGARWNDIRRVNTVEMPDVASLESQSCGDNRATPDELLSMIHYPLDNPAAGDDAVDNNKVIHKGIDDGHLFVLRRTDFRAVLSPEVVIEAYGKHPAMQGKMVECIDYAVPVFPGNRRLEQLKGDIVIYIIYIGFRFGQYPYTVIRQRHRIPAIKGQSATDTSDSISRGLRLPLSDRIRRRSLQTCDPACPLPPQPSCL